ncbi:hypothetical protein TWF730_005050 [Orbilia blumenaviensis]|uniref:DUF427 domain-containing protein n=1 Tax=Orbilia blumenaviensis TaxID=1796055 RepID=A0AAV9VH41_9PEZI
MSQNTAVILDGAALGPEDRAPEGEQQATEDLQPKPLDPSGYLEEIGSYRPIFPPIGHCEVYQKRIRAWHQGTLVLDTERAICVWENAFFPTLYVPKSSLFERIDEGYPLQKYESRNDRTNIAKLLILHKLVDAVQCDWGLFVKKRCIGDVMVAVGGRLKDYIHEWREHEDVIVGFPRDPYKAITINNSSRSIEIKIGSERFVSDQAIVLSQKGYPPRYYFTRDIFKFKLASGRKFEARDPRKNGKTFLCPYKGQAEYFDMTLNGKEYENICWRFTQPPPEVYGIKNRYCFNTRLLTSIRVDGVHLPLETIPGNCGMSEEDQEIFYYDV